MYWFILFIAGILEAGWLVSIQKSESFTNIPYVICGVLSMTLSLILFSVALKEIPINLAYLVWLAVGASAISIINHYFFNQALSVPQILCLCLIFIGVVGLKLFI